MEARPVLASTVQLASGKAAEQLLADPAFQKNWIDLAAACPWATGFQALDFADAWYDVYKDLYDVLLLFQHDNQGRLIGLLPLAVEIGTSHLVHVGAHQAEYQVWIACEASSDRFIEQALNLLRAHYPRQRLRLRYLPSNVPQGWRAAGCRWRHYSILQEYSRPYLVLGGDSSVEKSLKKRGNRNRINRLKRNGTLSFAHVQSSAELERLIDTVADFYDLRQGAISPFTPFRDDPRKREFTLRLLDKPGLTHASVLMLDDVPIAANIGPISRSFVSLGVFGYSPFYEQSSPGRMLILLLGQQLGNGGVQQLDLTSGGDSYKDEMADHTEPVYVLSIQFDLLTHAWQTAKAVFTALLKRSLNSKRRSAALRARDFFSDPITQLKTAADHIACLRYRKSTKSCYEVDIATVALDPAELICQVNSISDLLLYKPSRKQDLSRRAFLGDAWRKFESGDRSYTYSKNGILLHCAWLRQPGKGDSSNSKPPPNTCLLWDGYTHPSADWRVLTRDSLSQRIHDAAAIPGVEKVLVEAEKDGSYVPSHANPLKRVNSMAAASGPISAPSGH